MTELNRNCGICGAILGYIVYKCPSCGTQIGYPNVQIANLPDEISALNERYGTSEQASSDKDLSTEFQGLVDAINNNANVVVAMTVELALQLVTSDSSMYVNYEKLVGSQTRAPAAFANDQHRRVVAGSLFGSYGEEIVYGALSLSNRGLSTYGDIYCKLKRVAIEKRASFLEMNSYDFTKGFDNSTLPQGYRADWENKAKLVAIKFEQSNLLKKGQRFQDWEQKLLVCNGKNRNLDEFVEAHIFGGFNLFTIEEMVPAETIATEKEKLAEIVIDNFKSKTQH